MFIVLDAWKRTQKSSSLNSAERLSLTMKEAGLSITFAATTDVLSFSLGIISNIPAVSTFCLFTSVAIAFDYGYQMTFYLSVISISGQRESNGKNSCCCCLKSDSNQIIPDFSFLSLMKCKEKPKNSIALSYAKFLNSPFGKLILVTSYFLYLVIALLGCCVIRADVSPAKSVLKNCPYTRVWEIGEKFELGQGFLVEVIVSNPPDLRDENGIKSLDAAVSDLESISYSVGANSTVFWLREFVNYMNKIATSDPYAVLTEWMELTAFGGWKSQIQTIEANGTIKSISKTQFVTGYKGVTEWADKIKLVNMIRSVTAKYPLLNITVFQRDFFYIDLFQALSDGIAQVSISRT